MFKTGWLKTPSSGVGRFIHTAPLKRLNALTARAIECYSFNVKKAGKTKNQKNVWFQINYGFVKLNMVYPTRCLEGYFPPHFFPHVTRIFPCTWENFLLKYRIFFYRVFFSMRPCWAKTRMTFGAVSTNPRWATTSITLSPPKWRPLCIFCRTQKVHHGGSFTQVKEFFRSFWVIFQVLSGPFQKTSEGSFRGPGTQPRARVVPKWWYSQSFMPFFDF